MNKTQIKIRFNTLIITFNLFRYLPLHQSHHMQIVSMGRACNVTDYNKSKSTILISPSTCLGTLPLHQSHHMQSVIPVGWAYNVAEENTTQNLFNFNHHLQLVQAHCHCTDHTTCKPLSPVSQTYCNCIGITC